MQSHFISHNSFATARKLIYAACSIQAEINNAKSTSPVVNSGEERGLFSRTAAGNRAYTLPIYNVL